MVALEIIRRFVAKIKEKHPNLNEPTIEKDFYLTLLLSEISKDIEEDKDSPFSKLVFKGGTLLTRTHLQYHRISEDLDFTCLENKKWRIRSPKQRNKAISNFTNQLVERISVISKEYGLNFSTDKSDTKYCKVLDRKGVYLFKGYYIPVYGTEEVIKWEVNFNDELVYPPIFEDIKHLFDEELLHDLEFVEGIAINIKKNLLCYDLREVAMEKIRAVLTRPAIKERDLLDLFLISKKIDITALPQEKIVDKIQSAASFVKGLSAKIKQNLEILSKQRHSVLEEKSQLVLIAIDEKEYAHFEKKIMPLLMEIGKKSLMNLK
jgi:predicted nucleotidyltransferase component of viral defense system